MPTINAGSTFTTTIPAGTRFGMGRGTGTYRVGPIGTSASPTIEELIDPEGTWLGPFSGACSLTVRATTAVTYNTVAPFDALTQTQVVASPEVAASLVSGDGFLPRRTVGADNEQPAGIIKPVKKVGKLAANFTAGQWSINGGAPVLTQGHTGWDGSGNVTGVTSRTGQPGMLKVVPAANTSEEIVLGAVSTNMLQRVLGGKLGLWVYVENQPGYQPGGTVTGAIQFDISTTSASTNGMYLGWNSNQIREGWNFLKFVQRDPQAYVVGSGVSEPHPPGVNVTSFGTGADTNLITGTVNRLRINWSGMLGATLYFDSIWTDFESAPQIVLGNDAGIGLIEYALPLFQSYGWIGYAAFPYRVWASGSKTISDLNSNVSPTLQALYSAGWEAWNHTANHLPHASITSEAEVQYEMDTAKAWQVANGWTRGVEFYASPQSSTSRLSEKVIKQRGYLAQRHSRKMNVSITPWGIDNPHHLGGIDMGSATVAGCTVTTGGVSAAVTGWQTFTKIKRAVDVIEAYGDAFFPFWHGITTLGDSGSGEDATGDNLLITRSAFEMVCADIRAREQAGRITVCKGMAGFWYGASV